MSTLDGFICHWLLPFLWVVGILGLRPCCGVGVGFGVAVGCGVAIMCCEMSGGYRVWLSVAEAASRSVPFDDWLHLPFAVAGVMLLSECWRRI